MPKNAEQKTLRALVGSKYEQPQFDTIWQCIPHSVVISLVVFLAAFVFMLFLQDNLLAHGIQHFVG